MPDEIEKPDHPPVTLVPAKRVFAGGINAYPAYRSKLDDMLRDEHREEYEQMLVRSASVRKLWMWLLDRGYDIGRVAVERHRAKFLKGVFEVRRGADVALQFARIARAAGVTLSDSLVGGFHQMLMEYFSRAQIVDKLSGKDVQSISAGLEQFSGLIEKIGHARQELDTAATSKPADLGAVVDRVREILGG